MKTVLVSQATKKIPWTTTYDIVMWRNSAKRRNADVNRDEHSRDHKIRAYKRMKKSILAIYEKYSGRNQEDCIRAYMMIDKATSKNELVTGISMMRQARLINGNFLSVLIQHEVGEFHDPSTKFRPLSYVCLDELEDWTSVISKKKSIFFDTLHSVCPITFTDVWTADTRGQDEDVFFFSDEQDAMMFKLKFG